MWFYRFLKRFFDVFFSLLAIIVLSPLLLIVALIIAIVSPGPVLYKAKRVGKNGEIFQCYKFRSMKVDSGSVKLTTLKNDDRIFPFGKFIRKTKIDELPQLFNILSGKMSIVGPRPEDEVNAGLIYCNEYKKILSVRPGLTSPASLYDFTHGEKYEDEKLYEKEFLPQKLDLELYYVEHRNLIYDSWLILKTVFIILGVAFGKKHFKKPKELQKIFH